MSVFYMVLYPGFVKTMRKRFLVIAMKNYLTRKRLHLKDTFM